MPIRLTERGVIKPAGGPAWNMGAATFVAAASALFFALLVFLPRPLLLPAFSVAALAGAGLFVMIARRAAHDPRRVGAWDIAAALAFVGFAAAILGKPDAVAAAFAATNAL